MPAAVVLLRDDYTPSSGAYYFRQSAWSRLNPGVPGGLEPDANDRDLIETYPTKPRAVGSDALAEVGDIRRFGEGLLQFATRLGCSGLTELARAHLSAEFGEAAAATRLELLAMRREVSRQIAHRHPRWRRFLALLDPFSWLRAH